jgi:8-oxo-dGTP pyrophosphatase MutT (NUDIX family)
MVTRCTCRVCRDESHDTAVREIEEELGLTGVEGKLEFLGTVASSLKGATAKHGQFHCQVGSSLASVLDPATRWHS